MRLYTDSMKTIQLLILYLPLFKNDIHFITSHLFNMCNNFTFTVDSSIYTLIHTFSLMNI